MVVMVLKQMLPLGKGKTSHLTECTLLLLRVAFGDVQLQTIRFY